jgi:hypothetical protein
MTSTQKQKTICGGSVAGSSNEAIPGSIARAVSLCGGKRKWRIIWLSCIWPVLNSSSPRPRFSDKFLEEKSSLVYTLSATQPGFFIKTVPIRPQPVEKVSSRALRGRKTSEIALL